MSDLQLDVTLSIVGPRQHLLEQEYWPMALRIAPGFDIPSGSVLSKDDARQLVSGSLPWHLWPADLPGLVIEDNNGRRLQATPEKPLGEDAGFLQAVQASIEQGGHALCDPPGTLSFRCAGGQHGEVEDAGNHAQAISWPGLLNTLSGLGQPTPSALKATWFFLLRRADLCKQDPATGQWQLDIATLSAAPMELQGAAVGAMQSLGAGAGFLYNGKARVFCNVLALDVALNKDGLDELDNYWLTIRDSRDDSLLDLAHQLDSALTPSALLGALTHEELLRCCVYTTVPVRSCTDAELGAALQKWREALSKVNPGVITAARTRLIAQTVSSAGIAAEVLKELYRRAAASLLRGLLSEVPMPVAIDPVHWEPLSLLFVERLLPHAAQAKDPAPVTSGEGIALVIGDERLRLLHEEQAGTAAVDEVAGIQLWARRSSDLAGLATESQEPAEWHALSAGRYVVAGSPATSSGDRVFAAQAAYVDKVLYREILYLGSNLVCHNPLQAVHDEEINEATLDLRLAPLERHAAQAWQLLAVPLRYGDHYEFAASVVDRAGGQAADLTVSGKPWDPQLAALATLDPPQRDYVHFLRRVPVGSSNLLPPNAGWPSTPADVVLRCLEDEPRTGQGKHRVSICLVPDDSTEYRMALPEVRFAVEPPQTDEHTALRWYTPRTDATQAEQLAAVELIMSRLGDIFAERKLGKDDPSIVPTLVQDPAVTAIGIRWRVHGGAVQQKVLPAARREFVAKVGNSTGFDGEHTFTVAAGSYVRISMLSLVSEVDFARFDAAALSSMVEAAPWLDADGRVFRAFEEDVLFAECATHELPTPQSALLELAEASDGDVEASYQFNTADRGLFHHVHQMRLASRRWTWRNLPMPPQHPGAAGTEEWRRRLASGPPPELADPRQRDSAPEIKDYYDKLSAVDGGMVARADLIASFPREALLPAVARLRLFRDSRDGNTPADYLHYWWTIRSRYAGVLLAPERSTPTPRRIALGFRGDASQVKPPRILAVLPLLSSMPSSPRQQQAGDATPFLVLLDEVWHREYGIGERLSARIATVQPEPVDPQPTRLRYGPLPDHNVNTQQLAALLPVEAQLDCFGPFGFTLDRGDDQVLANATAFVLYPPRGTPAHYNMFVEFERCLDMPSGRIDATGQRIGLRSEKTEAVPMYTLPDSAELWHDAAAGDKPLTLTRRQDGKFGYDPARLQLIPYRAPQAEVMQQYRYLLIAGNLIRDGGRAVDVFLPARALWLHEGVAKPLGAADATLASCTHGVVAEILLSGRFDPGRNEIDLLADAASLADLFKHLLPSAPVDSLTEKDAPGMFRRFSAIGPLAYR